MSLLSTCVVAAACVQAAVLSPTLTYTSTSGQSGNFTSSITTIPGTDIPGTDIPVNSSEQQIAMTLSTARFKNGSITYHLTVNGSSENSRLGLRLNVGSSNKATFTITGDNVAGGGTNFSYTLTKVLSAPPYIHKTVHGQHITITITNVASTTTNNSWVVLDVAEAPQVGCTGLINPVYTSMTHLDAIDNQDYTDTDPFKAGTQITQNGTLTLKYAVNPVTCSRDNMFPEIIYNGCTYLAQASIYDDIIYCRRIVTLKSSGSTYPFYDSGEGELTTIPAGELSADVNIGNLSEARVAAVPSLPSGSWFNSQYQVSLYTNVNPNPSGDPIYSMFHDETGPESEQQIQILSRPTVVCPGLDSAEFRRAYPTEVPITVKFGETPAAGKMIKILDGTGTIVCTRILDEHGAAAVPILLPSNFTDTSFSRTIQWESDEPEWNSVYEIKGGLTATNDYSNCIAGKLSLEGGYSRLGDIACMFRFQKVEGDNVVSTEYRYPVILDNGNYSLYDITPGTYRIQITPILVTEGSPTAQRWLSISLAEQIFTSTTVSLNNDGSLLSGDISDGTGLGNRDNEVNLADLLALVAKFGTNARSISWADEPDLDSDGEITLFDVMVIDRNWMASGSE